ncbi:MAG: hypothetical protein HZB24_03095 [Desulfobacterales bacterium]|nr:hypothetical protein [Desulfobacterales bacterium]
MDATAHAANDFFMFGHRPFRKRLACHAEARVDDVDQDGVFVLALADFSHGYQFRARWA